jgi:hypothetical protein
VGDPRGEITEGWPIGFYEYEYASHKTMDDRFDMVSLATQKLQCLQEADMVLVDSLTDGDPFLNKFGAWPDQAFCIDAESFSDANTSSSSSSSSAAAEAKSEEGTQTSPVLLYRGEFMQKVGEEFAGCRVGTFTETLELACF